MTFLHMRGTPRYFPGVVTGEQVDFGVCEGEIRALVGENGAGKSTLMKILGSVERKDAGRIVLDSRTLEPVITCFGMFFAGILLVCRSFVTPVRVSGKEVRIEPASMFVRDSMSCSTKQS